MAAVVPGGPGKFLCIAARLIVTVKFPLDVFRVGSAGFAVALQRNPIVKRLPFISVAVPDTGKSLLMPGALFTLIGEKFFNLFAGLPIFE